MNTKLTFPKLTTLLIGDIIMLVLFVLIGQLDHQVQDPQPVLRLIATAVVFAVPYLICASLLGAYQSAKTPLLFARAANAWLVAAPLGALLRSFMNGSGVILAPFLAVALAMGLLFLFVWRAIYVFVLRNNT
jgi:hypothetical protein